MSDQKFISVKTEWETLKSGYESTEATDVVTQFNKVMSDALSANTAISGSSLGLTQIDIPLKYSSIATYGEERETLAEFCGGIHSDVLELVDDPFSKAISDIISNMGDITTKQLSYDGGGLADRMQDVITSPYERYYYAQIINRLNDAEISEEDYVGEFEIDEITGQVTSSKNGWQQFAEDMPEITKIWGHIKRVTETGSHKMDYVLLINGWTYNIHKHNGSYRITLEAMGKRHYGKERVDAGKLIKEVFGKYADDFDPHAMISGTGVKFSKVGDEIKKRYTWMVDEVDGVMSAGGKSKTLMQTARQGFKEGATPFASGIKDLKNGRKVLGAVSIIGDALTIVDDFQSNIIDKETGEVHITAATVQKAVTDTAVDFAVSGGTAAAGAAVGSLFAPPIGTVVGFGVGMLLDTAVNKGFDLDGDGQKHSAVDCLKSGANALFDDIAGHFTNAFE